MNTQYRSRLLEPNIVKIDTEGYELEVLRGMGELLADESLRAIAVAFRRSGKRTRTFDQVDTVMARVLGETRWFEWRDLLTTRVPLECVVTIA